MYAHENFAVVLNANARRVSTVVRRKVENLVSPEHIYYSACAEDSSTIAREIVARGYPVVFTGGGDGTFVKFINDYVTEAERSTSWPTGNRSVSMPKIGVLHLGTGNAVASIVSSGNFECDLRSYVDGGYKDSQTLNLLEVEGSQFPFGGLGWDAELLNDYMYMKRNYAGNPFLKSVLQNVGGYFAAFFGRTVPRHISQMFDSSHKRTQVRITNLGENATFLHAGQAVHEYARGDVLYEGPSNISMFGTLPYYGHGMTVLPYSMDRPGYFHLRVATMNLFKVFSHLRSIWKGAYVGDDLLDWHATHVLLEFNDDVPYQFGGDGQGKRRTLEVRTSPVKVDLLRFI
jgi:diacylglycerol kinase family enzyme